MFALCFSYEFFFIFQEEAQNEQKEENNQRRKSGKEWRRSGEYPSKAVENKPRSDSRGFRVQSVERRTA